MVKAAQHSLSGFYILVYKVFYGIKFTHVVRYNVNIQTTSRTLHK